MFIVIKDFELIMMIILKKMENDWCELKIVYLKISFFMVLL